MTTTTLPPDRLQRRRPVVVGVVSKSFGEGQAAVQALDRLSLKVEDGEFVCLVGGSGCGKTTLLHLIAGLATADDGSIDTGGRRIGLIFQEPALFPWLTTSRNIDVALRLRGLPRSQRRARVEELLRLVHLDGFGDRRPYELSGGMQQRVGLARALAVDPEVLFFDEPFSALDPLIRRDMQDQLLDLQRRMHRTIVFITHDFAEAIKLGDRIAIMKDGSFDQVGTAAELIAAPATDYVRDFTKDIPKVKVLTAGDLATGPVPENGDRRVSEHDTVEMILPALLDDPSPIQVMADDGRVLGCVDRAAVIKLLAPR